MSKFTSIVASGFAMAVIGMLASTASGSLYSATVLADNPAAYFRMNETSGIVAQNQVTTSQTGTYLGGANTTLGVAGPQPSNFYGFESTNTGAAFNGNNSAQLNVTSLTTLSTTDYSYEVWINHTSSTILQYIGGRGDSSKFDAIGLNNNTLGFYNGTSSAFNGIQVTANVWHDIVLTRSGTDIKIYVDGSLGFSGTFANTFALSTTPQRILAGNRPINDAASPGSYDELSVYNTALTAEQVAAHYAAALPEPGALSLMSLGMIAGLLRRRARNLA